MRHAPTNAERKLWSLLGDRRFVRHKFRRQVPIGPCIADFACYESKLIVELDGGQHVGSDRDVHRDAELVARGFRILRLWNGELLTNPDAALDAIWHALEGNSP